MKLIATLSLALLATPALAIQSAYFVYQTFDRGVIVCHYRKANGGTYTQVTEFGTVCPSFVWVP